MIHWMGNDYYELPVDGWPEYVRGRRLTRLLPTHHTFGIEIGKRYTDDEERELHRRQDERLSDTVED